MHIPRAFEADNVATLQWVIKEHRLASLVTSTEEEGLLCSPVPLFLKEDEGEFGTLYGHLAKANEQTKLTPTSEALAILSGPDAYISPSWYATKQINHKVVPTWDYVSVHAHGPIEFTDDPEKLRELVSHLSDLQEAAEPKPWSLDEAPEAYTRLQLKAIVGFKIPIKRLEVSQKLSQNKNEADKAGLIAGLCARSSTSEQQVGALIKDAPHATKPY